VALVISEGQREVLERLSVSRTAPLREVQRARVLLLAADGVANTLIADRLGLTPVTVRSWRTRFETHDTEVPAGLDVHLILDNYATHKHPTVLAWLDKHPRFHLHFTPTSSSWLNLVERWFRELTDKALRRGVFHSVPDLIAAIQDYLNAHNDNPRPLIWTATADDILAKVARGRVALEAVNQN
jgi:transposase